MNKKSFSFKDEVVPVLAETNINKVKKYIKSVEDKANSVALDIAETNWKIETGKIEQSEGVKALTNKVSFYKYLIDVVLITLEQHVEFLNSIDEPINIDTFDINAVIEKYEINIERDKE